MINRIHFHTFGGGSYPRKLIIRYIFIFCLQRGGPMAGGEGEAYQCGSLEVLEASVYVKWPILFSVFNMMSD